MRALMSTLAVGMMAAGCSDPAPPPAPEPVVPEAPPPPAFTHAGPMAAALGKVPAEWKARKNPRAGDEAAIAEGEVLYTADCAACHGVKGDGDGPAATALPQRPSDFTDPGRWAATTAGEKAWLLKSGIPGTSMAPRDLEEDALWASLAFIENAFQNQ